jgi:hypothetical protein
MVMKKRAFFYATCGTFLFTTFGFSQTSLTSSSTMRSTFSTAQQPLSSATPLVFSATQNGLLEIGPSHLGESYDLLSQNSSSAEQFAKDELRRHNHYGSTYIPVDSWIYPAMTRLYSLGYVDTMFLSMRPWTRQSVLHMLLHSEGDIRNGESDEARDIYFKIMHALRDEVTDGASTRGSIEGIYSVYTRAMVIAGTPLRDSYHLGQTVVNDYGRPYQSGFDNITGASGLVEHGRLSLFVRGEYQHSPAAVGYSQALSAQLSTVDQIPFSGFNLHQPTIPTGPLAAQNPFRLIEATLSYHLLGHEVSFGKSDAWLGPAQGGALAWSDNAENIYSFRINRVEPLHIPLISRVLGPMRYDFFYGSLQGHTYPNNPYTHSSMFSFRPSQNFEFAFQRTVIFGGAGHEPVTLHTFLKSFFSISDTTAGEKYSRSDPGARFSDFSASYRLPLLRKYATFYVDSIAHDDVTPISAPRRAAYRTGLYISQFPGVRKLDLRVEAVSTDPGVSPSHDGEFNYFETIQRQGYTNKGFIMGDWIGREAKGGEAWVTYHLSGNEWVQVQFLNKKIPKDFVPLGTTQNSFKATLVKRFLHDDLEVNGWFQYERWKAPVYLLGPHSDATTAIQITMFPRLRSHLLK